MSKFDELVGPGFRERRLALGGRLTIREFQLSEAFALSNAEFEQIASRVKDVGQNSVARFSNGLQVIDFDITSRTVTQVRW